MSTLPPPPELNAPLPVSPAPEVLRFLSQRRSVSPEALREPGPSPEQLADLLRLATRVPDHGKLAPWRFVVLEGEAKTRFAEALEGIATARGDQGGAGRLAKLKVPPLAIVVISSPKESPWVPEWEQGLSAGAVCATLSFAALAMGFGVNWITDWYAYNPDACSLLGLAAGEKVAGYIVLGSPGEPPGERERPDPQTLTTRWNG